MDEKLLRPLEDFPAIWIASSAYIKKEDQAEGQGLDRMFQNRFTFRLSTQKPSVPVLARWMSERCAKWSLQCDDAKNTLTLLAERSQQIVGMALQVLNKSHKSRSKLITRKLVEEHIFNFDE